MQDGLEPGQTPSDEREFFEIVVLGAGVIGLTTALELQQRGKEKYRVTVVADAFPGDPDTGVKYTSQWAGAHHVYNTRDRTVYPNNELYHFEKDTFKTLWELSEPNTETEECFLRIQQTEYFLYDRITGRTPGPDPLEEMPSYQRIPLDQLPLHGVSGCTFQTLTIDTPIYLNWLFTRFIGLGGRTVRGHVQHLSQITEGGIAIFGDRYSATAVAKYGVHTLGLSGHPTQSTPPVPQDHEGESPSPAELVQHSVDRIQERRKSGKVDAVVVCIGLAASALGGVEDHGMYPVRGQTVIVRAPWVRFGITESGGEDTNVGDFATYVIPRRSGDVIVGGTRVMGDWFPFPREETTTDILTRALKLCPQLAPPEIRVVREPTLDDILPHVVGEGCGLRPARRDGIRIESEWWSAKGKPLPQGETDSSGKVLIVYNYGHAGYGYQTSWGTARKASDLLEEGLKNI